jgi:hypothetical protein
MIKGFATAVRDHWRGAFALPLSFWILGAFVHAYAIIVNFFLAKLQTLVIPYIASYAVIGLVVLCFSIFFLPVFVWWCVGVWRSADHHAARHVSRKAWPFLAQLCVGLLVLVELVGYVRHVGPEIVDAVSDYREDPQWGQRKVTVDDQGKTIVVEGPITRSMVSSFMDVLRRGSTISLVKLQSSGGRLSAARSIALMVKSKHMDTAVEHECDSACIVVFLAGHNRFIADGAKLGFHSASFAGQVDETETEKLRKEALATGVAYDFVMNAYPLYDDSLWYPSQDELLRSRVVTKIETHS